MFSKWEYILNLVIYEASTNLVVDFTDGRLYCDSFPNKQMPAYY